jgi:hypothetical protein
MFDYKKRTLDVGGRCASVKYWRVGAIPCLNPKSVNIKSIQAVLKTILFLVFVCKIHVSSIEIIIWRGGCVAAVHIYIALLYRFSSYNWTNCHMLWMSAVMYS